MLHLIYCFIPLRTFHSCAALNYQDLRILCLVVSSKLLDQATRWGKVLIQANVLMGGARDLPGFFIQTNFRMGSSAKFHFCGNPFRSRVKLELSGSGHTPDFTKNFCQSWRKFFLWKKSCNRVKMKSRPKRSSNFVTQSWSLSLLTKIFRQTEFQNCMVDSTKKKWLQHCWRTRSIAFG